MPRYRSASFYVAIILDVWSRCVHNSDRGSMHAAETYWQLLVGHGLVGSMGRKGNPHDNAQAESLMKILKLEAVYPMALETFEDVAEHLSTSTHGTGI